MKEILKFFYSMILFVSLFIYCCNQCLCNISVFLFLIAGKCISHMHCIYLSCGFPQLTYCLQNECYCLNM
ncbi:transmembrane protein, putative [Medicago truncatula]|uniref:Transmembrane protein, putative n=1 Tax=Medicago truncatula TaxID=3880 RepID=G7KL33_MEDTR|nr:transmembrane protein, putative [Medicago truncatula]